MTSSRPQKRINGDDIISHLPKEMKDKILTKLPIKDAVRTSILSTNWRYTWACIPKIVVKDDDLVPTIHRGTLLGKFHFERSVDLLLRNHRGPILKFDLSTNYHIPEAFDRWVLNLSTNGISKLTFLLNSESHSKYRIHSSFFSCAALQHVDLSRCLIELPHDFKGLEHLRTLKLSNCTISANDLGRLISSSPSLVNLSLTRFKTKDDLRIFSKGLKTLNVGGDFSDLEIDAPNLVALIIACCKNSPPGVWGIKKLRQSVRGLANRQQIYLLGFSVQYLIYRSPMKLLNSCLSKLSSVYLMVDLGDQKESGFTFSLLQKATNLQNLFLSVRTPKNTISSRLWDKDIEFKSLRLVEIHTFSESALAFVKFILSSSPKLRRLTLIEDPKTPKEGNSEIFKRLLKFKRASTRAEVIFE